MANVITAVQSLINQKKGIMKIEFLLIGINDHQLMKDAWISSDGLSKDEGYFLMGEFLQKFESEMDAIQWIMDNDSYIAAHYEYGVEIKKVFIK